MTAPARAHLSDDPVTLRQEALEGLQLYVDALVILGMDTGDWTPLEAFGIRLRAIGTDAFGTAAVGRALLDISHAHGSRGNA